MNAAILVLTALSALLAPAIDNPAPATVCDEAVATLAQIASDDEAAVCTAAPQADEPGAFDAGLDGVDGLAAQPTAKPPKPLGFCRCGCGIRCSTSADCGGGSCDRFITCC